MGERKQSAYVFDSYRVDAEERQLLRGEEHVHLTPKEFETLLVLVRNCGRVLTKDELLKEIWPDTYVEEANLANNISVLREALGGGGKENPYIKTVARRGYRFVAPVRELSAGEEAANGAASGETLIEKHTLTSVRIEQEEREDEPFGTEAVPFGAEADAALTTRHVNAAQRVNATLAADAVQPLKTALLPSATTRRSRLREVLRGRRVSASVAASLALLVGAGLGLVWGRRLWLKSPPSFQQVTFRRGMVASARFTPDGQTIIYSALWEGQPAALFSTRPESPESRAMGLDETMLLSISRQGEMAVLLRPRVSFSVEGTLARMPLEGGAPREVLQDVLDADWSPDGKQFAVIHWVEGACRLEYPIGHVLYSSDAPGWLSHVRVSPRGDRIAFLEHPVERFDDRGAVTLLDLEGHKQTLSRTYISVNGLNWSPGGDELWYTASANDLDGSLYAIDLAGRERQIATAAGRLDLFDVSRDGRALVAREEPRIGLIAQPPGANAERDLSWLDGSFLRAVSADGRTLLFDEENSGGGANAEVYTRQTDGSPAVRLGDGHALALSPDGRWALARQRFTNPPRLILFPTGAGEARPLNSGSITYSESAAWFPEGQRLLLVGSEPGHAARCFVYDLASDRARAVTPEGIVGHAVSPDGRFVVAADLEGKTPPALYAVDGGGPAPLGGVEAGDFVIGFGDDGRSLYVAQLGIPVRIFRADPATGRRELWREVSPADPTGLLSLTPPRVTPDGRAYAYTYFRILSDLYLVDGLK
ncbi:MAG TPA: winged helix-turn-helix domain-containing protein [Pyrinomonadaceae bacterium]|nr:winged helix-turn-helix domain-containing protein [Pyrinomonadaceae bacterium]